MSTEKSSNVKRIRNAWCFRILKSSNNFEMSIFCKNARGVVSPFSKSPQNAQIKIPWGPPDSCEIGTEINGDTSELFFRFSRRNVTEKFYLGRLNSLLDGANEFTQGIQSLVTKGQFTLLSQLLSLLSRSADFTYHHPDLVNQLGFKTDGSGIQPEDLKANGGSTEDLEKFISCAKASASDVNDVLQSKKRSIAEKVCKENRVKKPKVTPKTRFDEEVNSEDGVEKQYVNKFIGNLETKLDLLSVDPALKRNLNHFHIQGIKKQMIARWDPTLLSIAVRPEKVSKFDPSRPDLSKYHVVQGIHSFAALVEIERAGIKLPGINDGMYTVYVVNTEDTELILYGHLRNNTLSSVFVQKPTPQDLLKIYGELLNKQGLKLVERIAKLQLIGVAETKGILDLCKWPSDLFVHLLDVIYAYETYETLDVKESFKSTVHLNQGKLRRGQRFTMKNKKLVRLSRLTPEYFVSEKENILSGKKSLLTVIEDFEKMRQLSKVTKIVEDLAKCNLEELKVRHPGKFSNDKLETFIGAEINDKVTNTKGELLRKYFDSVINNKDEDLVLDLKEISPSMTVSEVVGGVIKDCDLLIVNFDETSDGDKQELFDKLVENDIKSVMMFPNEFLQLDALSALRLKESDTFIAQQILFEKEHCSKKDDTGQNVEFGILCGNLSILYDGPIKIFNGSKDNFRNLIERIVPPGAKIVSVTDTDTDPLLVHKKDLSRQVSYYCYKKEFEIIKTSIQEEGSFIHEETTESEDKEKTETSKEKRNKEELGDQTTKSGSEDESGDSDEGEDQHIRNTLENRSVTSAFTSTPKSSSVSNTFRTMENMFGKKSSHGTKVGISGDNLASEYDFELNESSFSTAAKRPSSPSSSVTVGTTAENSFEFPDSHTILAGTPQPPTGIQVINGQVKRYYKTSDGNINSSSGVTEEFTED